MGRDTPLSAEQDALVDANIFYAIGRPSNPQYQRFRRAIQHAGVVCKLPRRVIGELGGSETDRVRTALDEGWPRSWRGRSARGRTHAGGTLVTDDETARTLAADYDVALTGSIGLLVRGVVRGGLPVETPDEVRRLYERYQAAESDAERRKTALKRGTLDGRRHAELYAALEDE